MVEEVDEEFWLAELDKRDDEGILARYEEEFVKTKAGDAVAWINDVVPAAALRLRTGALSERTWIKTVCDVVFRVLRNPSGKQNESDGVYSYGINAAVASGNMWLTKDDLAALEGSTGVMPGTILLEAQRGWGR